MRAVGCVRDGCLEDACDLFGMGLWGKCWRLARNFLALTNVGGIIGASLFMNAQVGVRDGFGQLG